VIVNERAHARRKRSIGVDLQMAARRKIQKKFSPARSVHAPDDAR
jgi:hypothetical protein